MSKSSRLALLAVMLTAGAFLAPASPAAAASCTGTPHDAAQPKGDLAHEIDVFCDTAITSPNGAITVRVNRGGDVDAHPTIANGTGSFNCNGQNQTPGSQFQMVISCAGSMTANATAQILASFGPNPCSSPTFSGDLQVAFGDGSTFGPSPLATYDCSHNSGGGGGNCVKGKDCDPGGVFGGVTTKPPSKASVSQAKKGLKFTLKLGVKGKVRTTIEVKGKSVGSANKSTNGGNTKLVAKLGSKAAKALAGKTTKAKIHVHVVPDKSEGFTTPGEKYFSLKLTG